MPKTMERHLPVLGDALPSLCSLGLMMAASVLSRMALRQLSYATGEVRVFALEWLATRKAARLSAVKDVGPPIPSD